MLFEPIDESSKNNLIDLLKKAVAQKSAVIATCFNLNIKNANQIGTCLLFNGDDFVVSESASVFIHDHLKSDVKESFDRQCSQFIAYQQSNELVSAFIEYVIPPVDLVVVGAGHDAIPLTRIGNILGWNTKVIDGRDAYAKPERFEATCQVIRMNPEELMEKVEINQYTAFVLVTHNYNYDKAILKLLLPLMPAYIGMLGPKKKLKRMLDDLKSEGMEITQDMLESVYGPTGLDIGAESPEEIALSIIAEIQTVLQGKHGGSLRVKTEVIHDRERNKFKTKWISSEK